MKTMETIEMLNDLVQINNDRMTGYERALHELKNEDDDLKNLFINMVDESRWINLALGEEVQVLGADMDKGTTGSGKIYRAWMDVKAAFTGHDRHSILASCEFGEDAAQKAYKTVLGSDDLPSYLREMITKQQQTLKASHDKIKALRDSHVHANV